MILSITVIFFVSWLPLNLFNFLMDIYPDKMKALITGHETVIYAILHLFGLCNALTNPILYGYLNENFRKEYKNIYRLVYIENTFYILLCVKYVYCLCLFTYNPVARHCFDVQVIPLWGLSKLYSRENYYN